VCGIAYELVAPEGRRHVPGLPPTARKSAPVVTVEPGARRAQYDASRTSRIALRLVIAVVSIIVSLFVRPPS
jgi:hypothetical protein